LDLPKNFLLSLTSSGQDFEMKRCAFITMGDDGAAGRTRAATGGRASDTCGKRGPTSGPSFNWSRKPAGGWDYQPDRLSWATFSWVSLPPASRLVQCHRASLGDQLKNSLVLVQSR